MIKTSKRVLKELKQEGLIKDRDYNFYTGVSIASTSFVMSSGGAGSGAGGGQAAE